MDGLTPRQTSCLKHIIEYIREHGIAPTRRELVRLAGQKSTNGVRQILLALEKKGYLRLHPPGGVRNIVVLRGLNDQRRLARPPARARTSEDD